MSFRKSESLKHILLPIEGHTLVHIDTEHGIALIFTSPGGTESRLSLEFEVILGRSDGSSEVVLATSPGPTFDPDTAYEKFSPLLDKAVTRAFAHSDGQLEIAFEEGTTMRVHPDNYEAWHFQQPAPGSRKPYHDGNVVSITGYGGGLI